MGTEASWLLPAALIGVVAGLWLTRRFARTDRIRASLLLWGGWLVVTAGVFSFMDGIIHPYYTVALAPAIAALVGISVRELWRGKEFLASRILLATMMAGTGVWAFILMNRTPEWWPAVRWIALVGSIVVAAIVVLGAHRLGRWATVVLVAAAMLFGLLGPAAFSIQTITSPHSRGPMAMAGPSPTTAMAPPGGTNGPDGPGGPGGGPGRGAVGSSDCRLDDGGQPRTEDRRVGHVDRRVHRLGQLAHAGAVPGLRRQP
jgi:4-amino-4-deoxy-L-arabinose transferase-like glycosyltransferase